MFQCPAQAGQVGRQRFCGDALAVGMLQAVDVHGLAANGVREPIPQVFTGPELMEESLAPLGSANLGQSAAGTTFHLDDRSTP